MTDPRCVLHSPVGHPDAGEPELKLHGRAAPADDLLRAACRQSWWHQQPHAAADVYRLDLAEAVPVTWGLTGGRMTTVRRSPRRDPEERQRRYP